jgi:hypothetical protein
MMENDAAIYARWIDGDRKKTIAHDLGKTLPQIRSAIDRHRKRNNLPNGRKAKGD